MSNPSDKDNRHSNYKRRKPKKSDQNTDTSDNLIFGLHAIQAALELPVSRVTAIYLDRSRQDARVDAIQQAAKRHAIKLTRVDRDQLDDMAIDGRHQGAIAECTPIKELNEADLFRLLDQMEDVSPLLLILDGVQDPHNLGACLRTAEAAGAHAVIAPKDRASGLTATAMKVSSGSAERLPFVQVTNLARVLRELKDRGIWLVGTSGDSEQTLFDADLKGPLALILGAEGRGIRRLTREHCDQVVYIPMKGQAESLNVSVAAGVCLFESARQRDL